MDFDQNIHAQHHGSLLDIRSRGVVEGRHDGGDVVFGELVPFGVRTVPKGGVGLGPVGVISWPSTS